MGVTNRWVVGQSNGDYYLSPGIRIERPLPIVEVSAIELARRETGEINRFLIEA